MFRTETGNLIERMIRGRPELIGLVVDRMWGRLVIWSRGQLSKRLRAEIEPEDMAQEILARVVRALPSFEGEERAAFYKWFFTIARNAVADQGKAAGAQKRQKRELPGLTQTSPSMHAARIENIDRMSDAMVRLDEPDRAALTARYLEELPYSEVAEVLGCSEAAARVRVCRALKRLRSVLESWGRSDDGLGREGGARAS